MKQRVIVQAIIKSGNRILLLKRLNGNPIISGHLELPGGTIDMNEQPDDALRRHIKNDLGIKIGNLDVTDSLSLTNREDKGVQHVFIVYSCEDEAIDDSKITLGQNYDSFIWVDVSELESHKLRDSAGYILSKYYSLSGATDTSKNVDKKTTTNKIIIYSDGGSRGNPGPSSSAFVIMDLDQNVITSGGKYLGITTNNQAEYHGVRLGLEKALELGYRVIEFRIDSMLVVNQLKGLYKIKNRELWPINERVRNLINRFDKIMFVHVPRELNQLSDSLVNKLLDEHKNDS